MANTAHAQINDEKLNRICERCAEAFSEFLNDMADHNAKVVCTYCRPTSKRKLEKSRLILSERGAVSGS